MEGEPKEPMHEFETSEDDTEFSVVIIKPDAIELDITSDILDRIRELGFEIAEQREIQLDEDTIFRVWPDIYGENWVKRTVEYLTSRPVIACIVRGPDSIKQMLQLKFQLRQQYPSEEKVVTVIHASDSIEESRGNRSTLFT